MFPGVPWRCTVTLAGRRAIWAERQAFFPFELSRPFPLYDLTISGSFAPDFWIAGPPSTCCSDKPLLWLVCSCCGCMSKTQLLGMCRLYKHHFAAHYSQGPNISPYYPAALGLVWVACTHHKISTQHYRYSLGHARHSMTTLQSQFDFRPHNEANPHCNAMQSAISPAQTNTPTTLIIAVHCYTTGQNYPIRSNHTHFHLDNSAVSGAALLFSFR
jgi:hypothetical protein